MNDLIQKIDWVLEATAEKAAIKESLEWYLRNNLVRYKQLLQSDPSQMQLKDATRALMRFCTESMDWNTVLYRDCMAITSEGSSLAKRL
jgi:hypothetical protein